MNNILPPWNDLPISKYEEKSCYVNEIIKKQIPKYITIIQAKNIMNQSCKNIIDKISQLNGSNSDDEIDIRYGDHYHKDFSNIAKYSKLIFKLDSISNTDLLRDEKLKISIRKIYENQRYILMKSLSKSLNNINHEETIKNLQNLINYIEYYFYVFKLSLFKNYQVDGALNDDSLNIPTDEYSMIGSITEYRDYITNELITDTISNSYIITSSKSKTSHILHVMSYDYKYTITKIKNVIEFISALANHTY